MLIRAPVREYEKHSSGGHPARRRSKRLQDLADAEALIEANLNCGNRRSSARPPALATG
jgi:hypothetical protein